MEAGRRIGKYVLDERIAVGGMAEVWAAHAEGREGFVKPVALKFILESFSGDPELERLFVNEARIAARLQHANLVAVFDFDKIEPDHERGLASRYYIAMERVEGQDLRRIAEAARRTGYVFPAGVALHVAGEVLKALRYVHERRDARGPLGLVHRDVSPHNVLVGYGGEVKLSDFGIAKAREHSGRTTKPGGLRGKIAYASPEQLGAGAVDHRTDQFAAGVTIWELLAGRRLFEGSSDLEIIGKVARCEIPPLGAGGPRPDLPPAVEGVLRRMLAAAPGDRFQTTAAALAALLGLPSYSPDGAPLGELVRTLFRGAAPNLSQTVPIEVSPGGVRVGLAAAETRTMHEAGPRASDGSGRTPTRNAKRTVEALARSPVAGSASSGAGGPTEDVRSRRGGARLVGVAVVGLALAGVVVARKQLLGASEAPSAAVALAPSPAPLVPPPPVERPPASVVAAPAPVVSRAAPALAPSRPVAPAVPAAVANVPAHETGERHRAAHRHHAPAADDAPVAAPAAPAPHPGANGAPIIE